MSDQAQQDGMSEFHKKKRAHMFRCFDYNKDGYNDKTDLENIAKNISNSLGYAEDSAENRRLHEWYMKLWARISSGESSYDANKDVQVSFDEYLKGWTKRLADMPALVKSLSNNANSFFEMLDLNGNGTISKNELKVVLKAYGVNFGEAESEWEAQVFQKKEALNRDEFRELYVQYFASDDPEARGNWLWGPLEVH